MGLRLTRSRGQSIVIADGLVKVEVLKIRDNKVELNIVAPRDINVIRGEKFSAEIMESVSGRSECVYEPDASPLSALGEERTD